MTNYENLLREQMQNPEFAKAYHEAKLERKLHEILNRDKRRVHQRNISDR